MEGCEAHQITAFREVEKLFRRPPEPNGSQKRQDRIRNAQKAHLAQTLIDTKAVDFGNNDLGVESWELLNGHAQSEGQREGQRCVMVYALRDVPGFRIVRGAIAPDEQRQLVTAALSEWCQLPNHTNLDQLDHNTHGPEASGTPKFPDCSTDLALGAKFSKLRWATLGMQYDWTAREYRTDTSPSIPPLMLSLVARICGMAGESMRPEAGLINYYRHSDTLCGHVDDAEEAQARPIVSISVGCSCVFLIGGRTRDVRPLPILLHSGDVIIMSGESRFCFHGVPRILENTLPLYLEDADPSSSFFPFSRHLATTHNRINLNLRQVYL